MTFFIDNIVLIVLALVSGGLLLWPKLGRGGGATALNALEATQLINHRNAIVVDLRDEAAFRSGSLAGARHLPQAALVERIGELSRFKARPVLVVCATGQQSARAVATFKEQGFAEAFSLAGGIAAWKQAALPLVVPGRDNARPPVKEPSRKVRNEQRSKAARLANAAPADAALQQEPVPEVPVEPAGAVAIAPLSVAEGLPVVERTPTEKVG